MSRDLQAHAIAAVAGTPLQPGDIQFYQAIEPPLVGGLYQLTASQTVNVKNEQPAYTQTQQFTIDGARFRLQPDQVQQVYPPSNETGAFAEVLPHVVFRQRTLPWSRTIDGLSPISGQVPPPWLALLTLYPGDLKNGSISVQQGTVGAFLTASPSVIVPALDPTSVSAAEQTQPLMYIELPQATFWAIAPSLVDLPYLAHARQVNTDGKEILGLDEDGFFSVLVGNRLPMSGAVNTVLAVSLEGLQNYLPVDGQTAPTAGNVVRMAVLASWTFTSGDDRGDFLAIMKALSIDLLRLPSTQVSSPTPAQLTAQNALGWGYVPLTNNTRSGEETTSWYRGPCAPVACADDPYGPYIYSDHAIRYDPGPDNNSAAGTGMFDMSYAAAWQIGRLLALSDSSFATALMAWRLQLSQAQNAQQSVADLAHVVPASVTPASQPSLPAPKIAAAPGSIPAMLGSVMSHLEASLGAASLEHTHMVAAHGALTSLLAATHSAAEQGALPKIIPHEVRAQSLRTGMLSDVSQQDVLAQNGDPLRNLLMKTLGMIPARVAQEEAK